MADEARELQLEGETFARLVEKYGRAVYGTAYSIVGDFHLAEDIAQETYLKAYLAQTQLQDPGKVGAWLCTIARRLALDKVRQRRPSPVDISHIPAMASSRGIEESVLEREQQEQVWHALDQLTEINRLPVILFHLGGYSTRQIAALLDISTEAVESRLRRARRLLKKGLMSMVVDQLAGNSSQERLAERVAAILRRVRELVAQGDQVKALTMLNEGINLAPSNEEIRAQRAHVLLTVGHNQQCQDLIEQGFAELQELARHDPKHYQLLGWEYLRVKEYDKAIECFQQQQPGDSIHENTATASVYETQGELEKAWRHYQTALEQSVNGILASLQGLARLAKRQGEGEQALLYFESLVGVAQGLGYEPPALFLAWHAYIDIAELRLACGDKEAALAALKKAAQLAELSDLPSKYHLLTGEMRTWRSAEGPELSWMIKRVEDSRELHRLHGDPDFTALLTNIRETIKRDSSRPSDQ